MKQKIFISPLIYSTQEDYYSFFKYIQIKYILNTNHSGMRSYMFLKSLLEQKYIDVRKQTILDIGCNIGTYSFLFQQYGAKHITGFDYRNFFINYCIYNQQKLKIKNMTFKQQEFFHINLLFQKHDILFFMYSFLNLLEPNMYFHDKINMFHKYINSKPSKYIIIGHYLGGWGWILDTAKKIIEEKYNKENEYIEKDDIITIYILKK